MKKTGLIIMMFFAFMTSSSLVHAQSQGNGTAAKAEREANRAEDKAERAEDKASRQTNKANRRKNNGKKKKNK